MSSSEIRFLLWIRVEKDLDLSKEANWKIYKLQNLVIVFVSDHFVWSAFYQGEWRTVCLIQYPWAQFYLIWNPFRTTGFLSLCYSNAHSPGLYHFIYCHIRKIVLWVDMPSDCVYGVGVQKDRVCHRWRLQRTEKLDAAPWTADKIIKRVSKQAIFLQLPYSFPIHFWPTLSVWMKSLRSYRNPYPCIWVAL